MKLESVELIAFISVVLLVALIAVLHYTGGLERVLELIVRVLRPGEIVTIIRLVLFALIAVSVMFFAFLAFQPVKNSQEKELIKKLEEILNNGERLEQKVAVLEEEVKQLDKNSRQAVGRPKLDADAFNKLLSRYEFLVQSRLDIYEEGQKINQERMALANKVGQIFQTDPNLADPEAQEQIQQFQNLDKSLELKLRRVDSRLQSVETELGAVRKLLTLGASP